MEHSTMTGDFWKKCVPGFQYVLYSLSLDSLLIIGGVVVIFLNWVLRICLTNATCSGVWIPEFGEAWIVVTALYQVRHSYPIEEWLHATREIFLFSVTKHCHIENHSFERALSTNKDSYVESDTVRVTPLRTSVSPLLQILFMIQIGCTLGLIRNRKTCKKSTIKKILKLKKMFITLGTRYIPRFKNITGFMGVIDCSLQYSIL